MVKPLDIVVAGPDGSGTSTQIEWFIEYFKSKGLVVKDLRGSYDDSLWHSDSHKYRREVKDLLARMNLANDAVVDESLDAFVKYRRSIIESFKLAPAAKDGERIDQEVWRETVVENLENLTELFKIENEFMTWTSRRMHGAKSQKSSLASMERTQHTTYVDPNSADVWIMEEPSYRGSGLHIRTFELFRSQFHAHVNQRATASAFAASREHEFAAFRKPILDAGKIVLRSRSEESACYQIHDKYLIDTGFTVNGYLTLEGHRNAFAHAPSHIFVAHGPENWTIEDISEFHGKRLSGRVKDDEERNARKQLLVNQRYSTIPDFEQTQFSGPFLENLYLTGCNMYKGTVPQILRFDMTESKEALKAKMIPALSQAFKESGYQRAA